MLVSKLGHPAEHNFLPVQVCHALQTEQNRFSNQAAHNHHRKGFSKCRRLVLPFRYYDLFDTNGAQIFALFFEITSQGDSNDSLG